MKCPACKTQTLSVTRAGRTDVEVDVCQTCRGIWYDAAEFEAQFPEGAKELRVEKNVRPTKSRCPRCTRLLRAMAYPQTETSVLICPDCDGLWVTPGQVKAIRNTRLRLRRQGKLQTRAPIIGRKGAWVRYVNDRIAELETEYRKL